jgi:hypothetical protein
MFCDLVGSTALSARLDLRNLRAWYDRLATRPAYARHIM